MSAFNGMTGTCIQNPTIQALVFSALLIDNLLEFHQDSSLTLSFLYALGGESLVAATLSAIPRRCDILSTKRARNAE